MVPVVVILFSSCNGSSAPQHQPEATPKPLLEEKSASSFLKSARRDLVESLYNDIVDKTPALKALETEIHELGDNKNDSTKAFEDFNNKNSAYYTDANAYLTDLKDAVLKEKIQLMLQQSQAAYIANTASLNNLEDLINTKTESLNDLHILLKITTTMAVIEKYQHTNMPTDKPLLHVLDNYDATISKTKALSKK